MSLIYKMLIICYYYYIKMILARNKWHIPEICRALISSRKGTYIFCQHHGFRYVNSYTFQQKKTNVLAVSSNISYAVNWQGTSGLCCTSLSLLISFHSPLQLFLLPNCFSTVFVNTFFMVKKIGK